MNFPLCFITLGHFLLLTPSPEAEASGRCDYHLMSPVLPKSSMDCLLEVAVYEAGPVVGNLTLLIKPAQPDSDVHSEMLHHRGRDDHRSANTLTSTALSLRWVFFVIVQHNQSSSLKKNPRRHTSVLLMLCKKNVSCLPCKANYRIVTACCLGNTDRYFLLI